MTEPRWPTLNEVLDGSMKLSFAGTVEHAIHMCRAAWLASVDDPSKSPVGERRRRDDGQFEAIRTNQGHGRPWFHYLAPDSALRWCEDAIVKGWPVIGAVPGSPAAEVKS